MDRVHWNAETKTYSLGARIPQLDEYNTEGSDIQVLVDKELEKTLEEDSDEVQLKRCSNREENSVGDEVSCSLPKVYYTSYGLHVYITP